VSKCSIVCTPLLWYLLKIEIPHLSAQTVSHLLPCNSLYHVSSCSHNPRHRRVVSAVISDGRSHIKSTFQCRTRCAYDRSVDCIQRFDLRLLAAQLFGIVWNWTLYGVLVVQFCTLIFTFFRSPLRSLIARSKMCIATTSPETGCLSNY